MKFQSAFVLLLLVCFSLSVEVTLVDPAVAIDNQYIILFHEDASDQQRAYHMKTLLSVFADDSFDNKIIDTYTIGDFKGYAAKLSLLTLETVKSSYLVKLIEQDSVVSVAAEQVCANTQTGATWGINRISERALNLNGKYTYGLNGQGVDVYIIDTGILITHTGFQGRAVWGANFVDNQNTDCNGHGTHVAGTVGSSVYGVAKKSTLIAVKVLDCEGSGSNSGVISGVNWVASSSRGKRSVANMSLGGGISTALDNAVRAAIVSGVTMAVAAGNSNTDACTSSPADVSTAITVGATAGLRLTKDARSSFSNYGKCVHIFAPGTDITSTWIGSNSATKTISGTSMATPHIAGMAALYIQSVPSSTPAQVKAALVTKASQGIIDMKCTNTACQASPNLMAFAPCSY